MRACPPVLIIIFNRPWATAQVVKAARDHGVRQLYIAADGPRQNNKDDEQKCIRTREVAISLAGELGVKYLFSNENYGCASFVPKAIDWFFQEVAEGIILEDDCVPSSNFFEFVAQGLERFRGNPEVSMISGTSHGIPSEDPLKFRFTHYPGVWGWATWKRAWAHYDHEMRCTSSLRYLKSALDFGTSGSFWARVHFLRMFLKTKNGSLDSWAYRWLLSQWRSEMIAVQPTCNLVENVGFDRNATHTNSIPTYIQPLFQGTVPEPIDGLVGVDPEFERWSEQNIHGIGGLHTKIARRIGGWRQ